MLNCLIVKKLDFYPNFFSIFHTVGKETEKNGNKSQTANAFLQVKAKIA